MGIVQHREGSPRAADQRLDDNEGKNRKHDDADQKNAHARNRARNRSHLGTDDIPERATIAPCRQKQDRHVLDRAGEHCASENPQRTRQIAHLGGKHRTDQWTGPRDRCEVMAVEHVSIGRNVIETVVMTIGRRWPRTIDAERPVSDE
jgi:hypothetical protein